MKENKSHMETPLLPIQLKIMTIVWPKTLMVTNRIYLFPFANIDWGNQTWFLWILFTLIGALFRCLAIIRSDHIICDTAKPRTVDVARLHYTTRSFVVANRPIVAAEVFSEYDDNLECGSSTATIAPYLQSRPSLLPIWRSLVDFPLFCGHNTETTKRLHYCFVSVFYHMDWKVSGLIAKECHVILNFGFQTNVGTSPCFILCIRAEPM